MIWNMKDDSKMCTKSFIGKRSWHHDDDNDRYCQLDGTQPLENFDWGHFDI
jgi:hypothetical protein